MDPLYLKLGAALFSTVAYRVRGMGFSTTLSRLICLSLTALSVTALSASLLVFAWWQLLTVFLLTCATESLGHSKGMNFGSETGTTADAAWVLLVTGLATGLPSVLLLAYSGYWALASMAVLAFSLKPMAYYIGWEIPSTVKDLEQGGPLGEVFTGLLRSVWIFV